MFNRRRFGVLNELEEEREEVMSIREVSVCYLQVEYIRGRR
jgi:hypothetical protein